MLRTVLAVGDAGLASRLVAGLEPNYPLNEYALCAGRAQLAEAAGHHAEAAALYTEAVTHWHDFGNVPEHAHALLGQGRCLLATDPAAAHQPFVEARDLFAAMGYKPALAVTEALLEQTAAARAS